MTESNLSPITDAGGGRTVLALDTSTAALACALVKGGRVLGSIRSMAERNHSVFTVSHVKTLLAEHGVGADELDGIAVGQGPGSYTGMRIAVTLGKTLAWTWNKPLVGISSLEALAFGASRAEERGIGEEERLAGTRWFVPIMDARRGQAYTALFADEPTGEWARLAEDGNRLMADWVDRLAELALEGDRPAVITIAGDLTVHETQALRLGELLRASGVTCRLVPFDMEGEAIAELGLRRLNAGESDDVHAFIPNYTQLTEAEVNLRARRQAAAAEGGSGQ
ncbi:tRNA (adenosine(37)-N6)-threonylcarbamoyltransferase complex dimerization subunit type 1 TsaB [Paenibacillus methanolicus]|uniref:tRNA threonylcarbamoyladenosine biosynthesis protein TsaB n=1 Tax=Paenibacillus methanolicus TaxID=582686 RepID=A0A5S5BR87_9BACL|nr:tRNA (adenosine(37)-N6)-threonylcarbamoyltransferase complex dimerization subunit type 1 TsaB [Paenibacillus methanolicus]TYP68682.1 tRNA threonylcarbamoyladenosine biosynthesis protein TsaB [Paenibacillus methanolicus]